MVVLSVRWNAPRNIHNPAVRINRSCVIPSASCAGKTLQEFAELPVRHNEDVLNGELSKKLPWSVRTEELDSPHAKTHLLLQVFVGVVLPLTPLWVWSRNAVRLCKLQLGFLEN